MNLKSTNWVTILSLCSAFPNFSRCSDHRSHDLPIGFICNSQSLYSTKKQCILLLPSLHKTCTGHCFVWKNTSCYHHIKARAGLSCLEIPGAKLQKNLVPSPVEQLESDTVLAVHLAGTKQGTPTFSTWAQKVPGAGTASLDFPTGLGVFTK